MTRIAFGSCNRQNLPQNHFHFIADVLEPTHWFWTGDAIYATSNKISSLKVAYDLLNSNEAYKSLKQKVHYIDGVYDDHDFGINDAGKYSYDRMRQDHFLDFLGVSTDNHLRSKHGLYHTHDITTNTGIKIKTFFLDTRSLRDSPFIRSIGEWNFPFTALIAAFIRGMLVTLGFGRVHGGDILGKAQWEWLHKELTFSKADFNIIVSSIQVLTTNPG